MIWWVKMHVTLQPLQANNNQMYHGNRDIAFSQLARRGHANSHTHVLLHM